MNYVIGIDEVGRGPIAGPVTVCACAVASGTELLSLYPKGILRDSKKLSEKMRASILHGLSSYLLSKEVLYGVGEVDAQYIDTHGIVSAIQEAMRIALLALHAQGVPKDTFIFLDGSLSLPSSYQYEVVIKGDEKILEISLASIIAKEHRDAYMRSLDGTYPQYQFGSHVGYGTKAHYDAIACYGLTPLHRRSFLRGVKNEE